MYFWHDDWGRTLHFKIAVASQHVCREPCFCPGEGSLAWFRSIENACLLYEALVTLYLKDTSSALRKVDSASSLYYSRDAIDCTCCCKCNPPDIAPCSLLCGTPSFSRRHCKPSVSGSAFFCSQTSPRCYTDCVHVTSSVRRLFKSRNRGTGAAERSNESSYSFEPFRLPARRNADATCR